MAGPPLTARRLPKFAGTAKTARDRGFYATPSGDSVAAEALAPNCTAYGVRPPPTYPVHYRAVDLLENWPPDSVVVPPRHHASLCRFDWRNSVHRKQAKAFREAEVPFIVCVFRRPKVRGAAAATTRDAAGPRRRAMRREAAAGGAATTTRDGARGAAAAVATRGAAATIDARVAKMGPLAGTTTRSSRRSCATGRRSERNVTCAGPWLGRVLQE